MKAAALVAALCLAASPQAGAAADCLACHGNAGMQPEAGRNVSIDAEKFKASAHGSFGCESCHSTIKDYPHPKPIPKVDCSACHADAVKDFQSSVHAQAAGSAVAGGTPAGRSIPLADRATDPSAGSSRAGPGCQSCHGPIHEVLPASDAKSRVAKRNLPETCGACHADPAFLAEHKIPFARPVEAYRLSVHGRALEKGDERAPSCSDCHSNHAIYPARDPRSRINHWRVPETCGACHVEIKNTYLASVHGQAVLRGARDAPVCTDCHGEHLILAPREPNSLVNRARVSTVTCGRCHSDERLTARYNIPADRVPAFEASYHGLALRAGSQTVANCASCHGVHDILPSSDPRSTIHPANLPKTCGACHPGAGKLFALGPVHVRPTSAGEHAVVRWLRGAYLAIILVTVGFMLLHNLLDFFSKLVRGRRAGPGRDTVERMNLRFRVAHWMVMLSFPTLVVTGFALKFPEQWWAAPLLVWESKFAFRGTLHRAAGVLLLAALVFHAVHLALSRADRAILRALWPSRKDLADFRGLVAHNLGLAFARPGFGKFSYAEKIEYWAFVWGSAVMALTGFLLWFDNFTLRYFPKWVADAATVVHYYEAILATLSILVWHLYMVVFDPDVYPMDLAWLTGKTRAEHLRGSRPGYFRLLARGKTGPPEDATPAEPAPARAAGGPEEALPPKTEK